MHIMQTTAPHAPIGMHTDMPATPTHTVEYTVYTTQAQATIPLPVTTAGSAI